MFWPVQQTFKEKFQRSNQASVLDDQARDRRRIPCWVLSLTLVEQLLPLVYISMFRWALAWKNTKKQILKKIIWAQKQKWVDEINRISSVGVGYDMLGPIGWVVHLLGQYRLFHSSCSWLWWEQLWSIRTHNITTRAAERNNDGALDLYIDLVWSTIDLINRIGCFLATEMIITPQPSIECMQCKPMIRALSMETNRHVMIRTWFDTVVGAHQLSWKGTSGGDVYLT